MFSQIHVDYVTDLGIARHDLGVFGKDGFEDVLVFPVIVSYFKRIHVEVFVAQVVEGEDGPVVFLDVVPAGHDRRIEVSDLAALSFRVQRLDGFEVVQLEEILSEGAHDGGGVLGGYDQSRDVVVSVEEAPVEGLHPPDSIRG